MRFAILVVDMQEDFFAHERLARRRATLTRQVNDLLESCRQGGAAVIWIKQEFAPDLSDAMLEIRKKGIRVVIAGTPGASLLPELLYHPADHLLIKKRYSAFYGTELDRLLAGLRPDQLIIAGINTHACVRATVIDAYQRDYEILLARDCIDSHDAEHHRVSWRYMDGKMAESMSNEQLRSLIVEAA